MKMYRLIILIIIGMLSLGGCKNASSDNKTENTAAKREEIGGDIPVNRALAAKMLCLMKYDENEIMRTENSGIFQDVTEGDYFCKYVYKLYNEGIVHGSGNTFKPLEPLTIKEAEILLNAVNDKNDIFFETENKDMPISYLTWKRAYNDLLSQTENSSGIEKEELSVFATPSNSSVSNSNIITSMGEYDFSGYNTDYYIDKKIEIMRKGNKVVLINAVMDNKCDLKGVFFESADGDNIRVSYLGVSRYIKYDKSKISSNCANISISDGKIISADFLEKIKSSKVLSADSDYIETKDLGKLKRDSDFKVYGREKDGIRPIVCGSENNDFFVKDGVVYGAVGESYENVKNIRVVISTTGYDGYLHEKVVFTSDKPFAIVDGENSYSFAAKDNINLTRENFEKAFSSDRIEIVTTDGGNIEIKSIERNNGYHPKYEGILEIEKRKNGFAVVNETDIETYLKYVLPSEMKSDFSKEALKAQSVLARTYAINKIKENGYLYYGGNVDDSTMCQVYNNITETDKTTEAILETQNEILSYDGSIADAFFFAVSCGTRANAGETFDKGIFPSDSMSYLKFNSDGEFFNLKDEKTAYNFFRDWHIKSYDSESPFFRWKVILKEDEAKEIVQSKIKEMLSANNKNILYFGDKESLNDKDFGALKDMGVTKRGEGGNVYEMEFIFENATFIVKTEYAIRNIISPTQPFKDREGIKTYCKNAFVMTDLKLLPSPFFASEKKDGAFYFYGGGNGHGVGLSQFGANEMAKKQSNYKEILNYYFYGTEVKKLA